MVQTALHSGRAVSLLASKTQGDSNRILQKNYFKLRSRCGNSPNFPFESKRNIDKNRATSSVGGLFASDAPRESVPNYTLPRNQGKYGKTTLPFQESN